MNSRQRASAGRREALSKWIELSATEIKHLLGSAAEAHRLAREITAHLDTFADDIIDQETEKSFHQVIALLDEAAAIKSTKANYIKQ